MMLHPSYTDLMTVVNRDAQEAGEAPVVNSRYSIVMATAKRARQIIDVRQEALNSGKGREGRPMRNGKEMDMTSKPLSIAVEELNSGKMHILNQDD